MKKYFISFLLIFMGLSLLSYAQNPLEERQITCSNKDSDGDILEVGGPWGKATKEEVIEHIENKKYHYYIECKGKRVDVSVIYPENADPYIRTDPDKESCNNLDNLPSCSN